MSTTKRDTIDMAREAGLLPILDEDAFQNWEWEKTKKVLKRFEALVRADERALAAPVQQSRSDVEPVAWMSKHDVGFIKSEFGATPTVPLYTTPPNVATPLAAPAPEERKRQWTDIDIDKLSILAGFDPSHKVELGLVRSIVRTILRGEE